MHKKVDGNEYDNRYAENPSQDIFSHDCAPWLVVFKDSPDRARATLAAVVGIGLVRHHGNESSAS